MQNYLIFNEEIQLTKKIFENIQSNFLLKKLSFENVLHWKKVNPIKAKLITVTVNGEENEEDNLLKT